MSNVVLGRELTKHDTHDDCWIVIHRKVWNISTFLPSHPGGEYIILQYAGKDATGPYEESHSPGTLEKNLEKNDLVGTMEESWVSEPAEAKKTPVIDDQKPPLYSLISSHDFEKVAKQYQTAAGWAYYSSAATDLITLKLNKHVLDLITFVPRVMRNVKDIYTDCEILGHKSSVPVFIAPFATANRAHPDGELCLSQGAGASDIIYCVSTSSSRSLEDIVDAGNEGQAFFFQLYVNRDRQRSEELLRRVEEKGFKAIFVTVDTASGGKREADEREKSKNIPKNASTIEARRGVTSGRIGNFIDPALCWDDLAWIRSITKLPIVLKGIGSAMDARMAAQYGCQGITLSNHGGRNLDTSPAPIITLLEMHKQCPEVFDSLEVYVDSGIRRGTDIFKALCLGATAVSIGRPYLYSMMYGEEGVRHLTELLREELVATMRLTGCVDLSQVSPKFVNTTAVDHMVRTSEDHPYVKWRSRLPPRSRI